jgi:CRISPR type I-E-associated protein CasB/Cse2
MTDKPPLKNARAHMQGEALREVRGRYDRLDRGKTAQIRRCRTADEVALEGAYWRIGETVAHTQRHLPHVVLLFPLAPHASSRGQKFSFGRYLRRQIGDSDGATLRFRRLLDSRDRDELDHRLRGILRLAAGDNAPVDWGVLGTDILWFFAESDGVRRRWAQDFYAPTSREASPRAAPSSATSTPTA